MFSISNDILHLMIHNNACLAALWDQFSTLTHVKSHTSFHFYLCEGKEMSEYKFEAIIHLILHLSYNMCMPQ